MTVTVAAPAPGPGRVAVGPEPETQSRADRARVGYCSPSLRRVRARGPRNRRPRGRHRDGHGRRRGALMDFKLKLNEPGPRESHASVARAEAASASPRLQPGPTRPGDALSSVGAQLGEGPGAAQPERRDPGPGRRGRCMLSGRRRWWPDGYGLAAGTGEARTAGPGRRLGPWGHGATITSPTRPLTWTRATLRHGNLSRNASSAETESVR